MNSNRAICLFGHLRTFRITASKLNDYAEKIGADIFIYTWDTTDNNDSYHGLNMKSIPTKSIKEEVYSLYPRLKHMELGVQNDEINSMKFIAENGNVGIVGHQYHMWASVMKALEICQHYGFVNNKTYDYLICTRPDILINNYFERFSVLGSGFNFSCIKKSDKSLKISDVDLYDLFFIVRPNFNLTISRLLEQIVETNGKILANHNYFLNFLKTENIKLHPLAYSLGEDFELIRDFNFIKKLKNLFFNYILNSQKGSRFNLLVSNLRIRIYYFLKKVGLLKNLKYSLFGNDFNLSIDSLYSFEYFKFYDKTIKKELDTFKRISSNYHNFLDVGALHGIFSFVFTNGNTKKAIAVDPSPIAFPILERNLKFNPNDIECFQIALSNSKSKIRMKYNWQHLEATLNESEDDLLIDSNTMDDFLIQKRFVPDLIKIDVEGYEYFVLKGGINYLSKYKPTIFLELHHEMLMNLDLSTADVISFLTDLNYIIYDLDMNKFNMEYDYHDGVDRVVCVPENLVIENL